mgnify:CR=1 FL=1
MRFTTNFHQAEFLSKDGTLPNDRENAQLIHLAKQLQVVRDILKVPIGIHSGHRSYDHNRAIGGKSSSYHMKGMAADISVRGVHPQQLYDLFLILMRLGIIAQGGLHCYPTFVHYDTRGSIVLF